VLTPYTTENVPELMKAPNGVNTPWRAQGWTAYRRVVKDKARIYLDDRVIRPTNETIATTQIV
jgi:hypothetical protein